MSALLWIFAVFDVGALAMLAAELATRHGLRRGSLRSNGVPLLVVAIAASYVAELALLWYAVLHQAQRPPAAFVPLPLNSAIAGNKDFVVAAMIALAGLQTYLLMLLYRAQAFGRWVWIGCAALVAVSLASPVMLTADAYAYVADALLGRAAYAPPNVPFLGQFAPIDVWWNVPLPPTPYGPLWLVIAWLVTMPFGSLLAKVLAIRTLGAAAFTSLLLVMRALKMPDRIVAVTALNPGLFLEYVASAHNDLLGIVFICTAVLFVRRPAIAALLLLAGGLVKLTFALFGLPVLVRVRSAAARIALLVFVPAAAAGLSFLAGGAGYYQALLKHTTTSPLMAVLSGAVALAALVAMVTAVFRVRRLHSVVWLTPLAASYTLSSYVAWGLPYALSRRSVLGYLLIGFPLATVLIEVKFFTVWSLFVVVPAVFAWQILAMRKRWSH
ncbi:MAG TPA: hypothetical protein VKB39_06310 [Candidatus Baltobacteraceae bacterium]|nr:hypothetical protein [Candidatus Baltobacteraceae bacterium]